MFNAYWEPLTFEVPPAAGGEERWRCCLDTAAAPPGDLAPWASAPVVTGRTRLVEARSVVLLARALPPGSRGAYDEPAV
jgi:glycogen operon protein